MVTIVLQSILAFMFAFSAAIKLLRTKSMVQHWNEYRYPMWFMNVIALLELAGIAGMIAAFWIPGVMPYAAALLAILMGGAIHAHLVRAKHHPMMAINALAMLAISVILILS